MVNYFSIGLALFCSLGVSPLWGQLKQKISLREKARCEKVELDVHIKRGACYFRPTHHPEALLLYSTQGMQGMERVLRNRVDNNVYHIALELDQNGRSARVDQHVAQHFFGDKNHHESDFWTVYLTEGKPLNINLEYGLGDACVDLSGLSIHRFHITTGSADVNTFYGSGVANHVEMDTFCVRVDMGMVSARQLNLARAKNVVAEVGFGRVMLDFSDAPLNATRVESSVGTGSMEIILPPEQAPVKITVNNSMLCDKRIHRKLRKINSHTFVNQAYLEKKPHPILFDLDVSMGTLTVR